MFDDALFFLRKYCTVLSINPILAFGFKGMQVGNKGLAMTLSNGCFEEVIMTSLEKDTLSVNEVVRTLIENEKEQGFDDDVQQASEQAHEIRSIVYCTAPTF